jgi:hypothetical protein
MRLESDRSPVRAFNDDVFGIVSDGLSIEAEYLPEELSPQEPTGNESGDVMMIESDESAEEPPPQHHVFGELLEVDRFVPDELCSEHEQLLDERDGEVGELSPAQPREEGVEEGLMQHQRMKLKISCEWNQMMTRQNYQITDLIQSFSMTNIQYLVVLIRKKNTGQPFI